MGDDKERFEVETRIERLGLEVVGRRVKARLEFMLPEGGEDKTLAGMDSFLNPPWAGGKVRIIVEGM